MINKKKADGFCGICQDKVPQSNLNKFYCSDKCGQEAWRIYHPDETEPDWDTIPKVLILL